MKKLILLVSFLLVTFKSISQTATKTVSRDSIVCIPKQYMLFIIKDLEKGDLDKKQLSILTQNILNKDQQIQYQDSIVSIMELKQKTYDATIDQYSQMLDSSDRTIKLLENKSSKYKHQRNVLRLFAGALLVALIAK